MVTVYWLGADEHDLDRKTEGGNQKRQLRAFTVTGEFPEASADTRIGANGRLNKILGRIVNSGGEEIGMQLAG